MGCRFLGALVAYAFFALQTQAGMDFDLTLQIENLRHEGMLLFVEFVYLVRQAQVLLFDLLV